MEVRVGPRDIAIFGDEQVLLSGPDGSLRPDDALGYFVRDTRLVSRYELRLSRQPLRLVNSSAVRTFSARFEFVNGVVDTARGRIPESTLHLRVDRTIGNGVHEDIDIESFASDRVEFDLEVRLEGDFADIFDVRDRRLVRRGELQSRWHEHESRLWFDYKHGGFERGFCLTIANSGSPPAFANGVLTFRLELAPREQWHTCLLWEPVLDGRRLPGASRRGCHELLGDPNGFDAHLARWHEQLPEVRTGDADVNRVLTRAFEDLGAMRMRRFESRDDAPSEDARWVPVAGVPWYLTLFGRDTLVVCHELMPFAAPLAAAAMENLAESQGKRDDPRHDCQPGKLVHELRHGELAALDLIPQTPYYGTQDAPSLFVWAAGELWRWQGDRRVMARLRPAVEAALQWIDRDGDLDGDGLQEYRTRAEWGYYNQGWKDAEHAVVHADGRDADTPIAVCELQGYVVAAKRAWASVLEEAFDEHAHARARLDEADRLAELIEQRLWWESEGTYYFGLDGNKRPIESVASNPGHLLWAGAINDARAARVVQRLLEPDMWSGWGVRTLSSRHPSYNPFSYQRGSVWPHDNALIMSGCIRYGHIERAWQIARGLLDAAEIFHASRPPEVFAGLTRDEGAFPVQYLGANTPQAWASGAIPHLLSALLRLEPSAVRHQISIEPVLPPWLGEVCIHGLRVGRGRVDFNARSRTLSVLHVGGPLEVVGGDSAP